MAHSPSRPAPKSPRHLAPGDAQSFAVALMEHLVVPTFVIDREGRVILWNRACEQLTGIPAASALGRTDHWRAFYDSPRPCLADLLIDGRLGELPELYGHYDKTPQIGASGSGVHVENWCVMPSRGKRLYLAVDAGPVYDEAGQLIAVIETLRDLTAHKEVELELQRLACRDDLTGLANRRHFDERLASEWRRAARAGAPIALIMADLDCFKLYNDHWGHQMGDVCLRAVAGALTTALLRPGDLVARYGGEEFIVVLPGVDSEGARIVAERMRAAVEQLALPHPASTIATQVTLSAGAAALVPDSGATPDTLMHAADMALYRAKALGRNRIDVCGDSAAQDGH